MKPGEHHIFIPTASEGAAACDVILAQRVEAGCPPETLTLVWLQDNFRTPRVPEGVRVFHAPPRLLLTEALPREIAKRFVAAHWWRRLVASHRDILDAPAHWYINKPLTVPSNHAWRRRDRLSLSLLPDGLACYTRGKPMQFDLRTRARQACETLAGWSAGMAYEHISKGEHLTRFETGAYGRTYTFEENGLIARSGELVVLDRYHGRADVGAPANPRIAVLADQDLAYIVHPEDAPALRMALIEALNAMDLDLVWYKRHPRYGGALEEYRRNLRHEVRECEFDGAVEEFVETIGAGVLASYYSTALVNAARPAGLKKLGVIPEPQQSLQPALARQVGDLMAGAGCDVRTVDLGRPEQRRIA